VRIGGQEHFYLETQACIAIPKGEHGEMDIISGTQSPSDTQNMVAAALGVPNNRVVCHTKRIGEFRWKQYMPLDKIYIYSNCS